MEDHPPPRTDDTMEPEGAPESPETHEPPGPPAPRPAPLSSTFGTAVGAAMLGFEQAFRDLPPAQVMAAEHAPRRGEIGEDGDLVIEIPGLTEQQRS
jgi:hypothetical protein